MVRFSVSTEDTVSTQYQRNVKYTFDEEKYLSQFVLEVLYETVNCFCYLSSESEKVNSIIS